MQNLSAILVINFASLPVGKIFFTSEFFSPALAVSLHQAIKKIQQSTNYVPTCPQNFFHLVINKNPIS